MIRTIIFIIIIVIIIGCALVSPFGALLGYIWFALFRPQEWVWIDISALKLSLVLGCILIIRSFIAGFWPNLSHPISKGILAFLLTGLIAQVNAANQELGWYWLDFFARLTVVCLLLINLVNTERRLFLAILTVCTSLGYYTAKAGLVSLLVGGIQFQAGLAGAFIDNNGYALAAVMIVPLLIASALNVPKEWPFSKFIEKGYKLAVPLTAFTVVSTFSRGGLLALIAVAVAYCLSSSYKLRFFVLALVILIMMPFMPLPEGYVDRVATIISYEEQEETSAMSRLHFWRVALRISLDNPLGVGMFNFGDRYDQYDFTGGRYGKNRVAHNSHLQVLAENGFLGFMIWVFLFAYSFRVCFRIWRSTPSALDDPEYIKFYRSMSLALLISMCGFIVGGTFASMALNDLTWMTFALIAALHRLYQKKTATPVAFRLGEEPL